MPINQAIPIFILNSVLACVLTIYATTSFAQTPEPTGGKENIKCQALLPFPVEEQQNCSPKFAAAYDFAFCFVNLSIAAHFSPESNRTQDSINLRDEFKKRALLYAQVSVHLSDSDRFKKNIDYAKKHFEYLAKQSDELRNVSTRFIARGCQSIEAQHSSVLKDLSNDLHSKRIESQ